MPVLDTYTGVQELPAPAAPAPRRSKVSGSSRAERRHARSSSSRRRHPRHSSDDSGTSSSSSSHKGDEHAKLTDLFIDTKIEMMRMVEADLKLKLDVRQMKQCFYTLLQNFEAFEKQQIEQPEVVSTLRRQPHLKRPAPGTHRPIRRRVSRASSAGLEETSSSARCPNNTQASSAAGWVGTHDTASLRTGDYSRSRFGSDETALSDVIGASRVENMSAITQCSNVTYREQCSQSRIMDVGGPLSSTIRYPQYSTPEKKRPRASPVSPIACPVEDLSAADLHSSSTAQEESIEGHRRRLVYDRPAPAGADAPAAPRTSRPVPRAAAALIQRNTGSDSEATPVAVRAITRLPEHEANESDSGMCGSDTPSTLGRHANSRRQKNFRSADSDDLSLEVVTPLPHHRFMESLKALDGRMRRQTAQPDLSDELRSPVGLSETDLLDASSFFANTMLDLQCSTNATRASIANISALSTSPMSSGSDDVASSNGAESSYKESDATASSPPLLPGSRNYSRKQQDARYHSRQMSTVSRFTSGTSTSSCGGFLAPSNSPNATSDSATSGKLPREWSSSSARERRASHVKKDVILGARPACIGSDDLLMPAMPPRVPRAVSDPETSRLSVRPSADTRASLYAYTRAVRRETQLSGASSGGSTCSSDQSGVLANNTSKESTVSCIGVSLSPPKARGVRRSLSKRIKKLGKKIMKNNSRAKAEAQHSI